MERQIQRVPLNGSTDNGSFSLLVKFLLDKTAEPLSGMFWSITNSMWILRRLSNNPIILLTSYMEAPICAERRQYADLEGGRREFAAAADDAGLRGRRLPRRSEVDLDLLGLHNVVAAAAVVVVVVVVRHHLVLEDRHPLLYGGARRRGPLLAAVGGHCGRHRDRLLVGRHCCEFEFRAFSFPDFAVVSLPEIAAFSLFCSHSCSVPRVTLVGHLI